MRNTSKNTSSKVSLIRIPTHIFEIDNEREQGSQYAEIISTMVEEYKDHTLSSIAGQYEDTTSYRYGGQSVEVKTRLKASTAEDLKVMSDTLKISRVNLTMILIAIFYKELK